jgi:hypothetical protein
MLSILEYMDPILGPTEMHLESLCPHSPRSERTMMIRSISQMTPSIMRASHSPRICYRAIFVGAAYRRAPRSLFPETETRLTHTSAHLKPWLERICATRYISIHLFRSYISIDNKAEHLDPKFVNGTVTNATKDLAGIGQVPAIVQNTSSEDGNLQSVSDTVDTFSTLLTPLKAFNTIINDIANVRPSISLLHATNIIMFICRFIPTRRWHRVSLLAHPR